MQSAWEKLTDGRCNNSEPLEDGCTRKPRTARQLKEQAKLSMKGAQNKFKRAAALTKLEQQGLIGPKERRKLSDRWDKRTSNNTAGFYDKAAAREAKRSGVAYV